MGDKSKIEMKKLLFTALILALVLVACNSNPAGPQEQRKSGYQRTAPRR
jgi:PBP1b-binding outer membrane lipoprotein LpoB